MWLILAFISAILLGSYEVFKKVSLEKNAVIPRLKHGIIIGMFSLLVMVVSGCVGESENVIKQKLDTVVASDLKVVTGELPKTSLADSMYVTFFE